MKTKIIKTKMSEASLNFLITGNLSPSNVHGFSLIACAASSYYSQYSHALVTQLYQKHLYAKNPNGGVWIINGDIPGYFRSDKMIMHSACHTSAS